MAKTEIKLTLDLHGPGGNAFFILGKVRRALIQVGYDELAEEFMKEACSDDMSTFLKQ